MAAARIPLLGRIDELDRMLAVADRAQAGEGQIVLVAGDAGIGKTRLLGELHDLLADRATVLIGGCVDTGGTPLPLLPLMTILRQLPGQIGADPAAQLLASLPDLAPLVGGMPPAPGGDDSHSGTRLYGAVIDLVQALARQRPLVLIVEDLHWADSSTLALLTFLAEELDQVPVMIVASYRDDELHRRHPLRPVLAELRRLDAVTALTLGPLSRPAIGALAREHTGERPTDHQLDRLMARAQGNPLFTEHLLDGRSSPSLPASLEELLIARVERLPSELVTVLRAIAVCGADAPLEIVSDATGIDAEQVEQWLRSGIEARVLDLDPYGELCFRHALLAEAVERGLLPSERRRIHRMAADHLAQHRGAESASLHAARLSRHRRAAGQHALAFAAALDSARAAEAEHSPGTVHEQLAAALELWDDVDAPVALAGCERHDLLRRASAAAEAAGQVTEALALARLAVSEVGKLSGADADSARLLAAERLSTAYFAASDIRAAWETIDAAHAAVQTMTGASELARLHVQAMFVAMLVMIGEYGRAVDEAPPAIELAERIGEQRRRAELLNLLGASYAALGRIRRGLALLDQAITLAEANGHDDVVAHSLINRKLVLRVIADLPTLLEADRQTQYRLQGLRLDRNGRRVLGMSGFAETLMRCGRWDEAAKAIAELPRGTAWTDVHTLMVTARIALERGDPSLLRQLDLDGRLDTIRPHPMTSLLVPLLEARLALHDGDRQQAVAILEQALADPSPVSMLQHGPEAVAVAAEAAAGDEPLQRRVAALLERVERAVAIAQPPLVTAPIRPWLDVAVAWLHDAQPDRVERWITAVASLDSASMPYEAACARFGLARAALASGDRALAADALAEADAVARELRAEPLVTAIEDTQRRARLRSPSEVSGDAGDAYGLTVREIEVVRLLAAGYTNKEIGEQLFISTKTASVHVSNVLRKLGVENRRAAGRLAAEMGMLATS